MHAGFTRGDGLMNEILNFLKRNNARRFIILFALVLIMYLMRSLMNLFLITFILTYLMSRFQKFIVRNLRKFMKVNANFITAVLYVLLVSAITFVLIRFMPKIIREGVQIIKQILLFYKQPQDNEFSRIVLWLSRKFNVVEDLNKWNVVLVKSAADISKWGVNILMAMILSLFFLLEKGRIIKFTRKFKNSKVACVYNEVEYFGKKFIGSFGKVIEVQILIALINSILSAIGLTVMGFPEAWGLAIMIFFLGLIPVAGVFISLVPLCLIAFTIGGIMKVVYVLIMIALLHALESYVLNPKLMSSKIELPAFYTFIILIVSEHFFGIWGLLIGIPIFMFVLDILEVTGGETNQ